MNYVLYLIIPLFALLYRCRGGWATLPSSTIANLLLWSLPVGIFMALSVIPWWMGPVALLTTLASQFIPQAEFQNDDNITDVLGEMGLGIGRLACVLAPYFYFHPEFIWLLPFGLCSGLALILGYSVFKTLNIGLAKAPTEWKELFEGGLTYGVPFTLIALGVKL